MSWKIEKPNEFICTESWYLIKGKKYTRVTKVNSIIAKPELNSWYARQGMDAAKKTMKTRADFGSLMHKSIEVILKGEEIHTENYDKLLIDDLKLFREWQKDNDVKVEAIEQHLWSDKYYYAGTCDFIGKLNGKHTIGDWKTSKAIYPEYWLQLAAYVFAFEEQTGIKLDGAFILQMRDGKKDIQYKSYKELKEEFEVFLAAMKIYNWKYGDRK
jgi:hypothetical protein